MVETLRGVPCWPTAVPTGMTFTRPRLPCINTFSTVVFRSVSGSSGAEPGSWLVGCFYSVEFPNSVYALIWLWNHYGAGVMIIPKQVLQDHSGDIFAKDLFGWTWPSWSWRSSQSENGLNFEISRKFVRINCTQFRTTKRPFKFTSMRENLVGRLVEWRTTCFVLPLIVVCSIPMAAHSFQSALDNHGVFRVCQATLNMS